MRSLTQNQKNKILNWMDKHRPKNLVSKEQLPVFNIIHQNPPYFINKKPSWRLSIDDMDLDTYERIEQMNPFETFWQELENFLWDKSYDEIAKEM